MPQAGNEYARPETDARRAFRTPGQNHPHIRVERWRVVQPRTLIAQSFGELHVGRSVGRSCKCTRDVHSETLMSAPLLVAPPASATTTVVTAHRSDPGVSSTPVDEAGAELTRR